MSGEACTRARRETAAPLPGPIAADAFEALIENAIVRANDLFELDGDTTIRYRDGRVETLDSDLLHVAFE